MLGASAARVAESALSLFLSEIERPFVEASNADCLRLARSNGEAADALLLVPDVIAALLPEHLERAIRRQRADTGPPAGVRDRRNLTVGFVDLVDFTARSSRLDPNELAEVLGRFESLAWEAVVTNDGRVVKMIGDEVMFVTTDPGCGVCRRTRDLRAGRTGSVTARGPGGARLRRGVGLGCRRVRTGGQPRLAPDS